MGFERCHPAVNFIFFAAVIVGTLLFNHPAFLAISILCAFAYSVKRNGIKALVFNLIVLIAAAFFAYYYSTYNHFGVSVLGTNYIGNNITVEALLRGFSIGATAAAVLMWLACVHSVFTADKVVYLFGKLSPKLSLFLAILLRFVPRIKAEARSVGVAQKGIGRGASQGNILSRVRNALRIVSILISGMIESLALASDSMRSRGSLLKGRRAFSIYRFDARDRAYVICMFLFLTITMMAVMLGQTRVFFAPRIIIPKFTFATAVFCAGYLALCAMPLLLELATEFKFRKARKRNDEYRMV